MMILMMILMMVGAGTCILSKFFAGESTVGRGWAAVGWVAAGARLGRGWGAAGWIAAGGGDPPAAHPDGNGNKGNNGNGNNGDGNEPVSARLAPNQRAQGSHMPHMLFGAPPSTPTPLTLIKISDFVFRAVFGFVRVFGWFPGSGRVQAGPGTHFSYSGID